MEMKETEAQNASIPQEEPAVSQDNEAVVTAQTPAEDAATVNVADGEAETIANEMAPAEAAAAMPAATAPVTTVKKPSMTFAQFRSKYLNQKVINLVLKLLGLVMLVLSVLEFAHLALLFTNIYGIMIDAVIGLHFKDYFQIIITLIAFIAYFMQILVSIIAFIKKGHKVRLDHIATPLAIAVLWRFFAKYGVADAFFCYTLQLGTCYKVLLWVLLVYIIIRMLKSDWDKRLGAVVCGMVGIALIIGQYLLLEGNAAFNMIFQEIESIGLVEYARAAFESEGAELLILILYMLSSVFSILLPFMALSMIGYYVDVLAGDEAYQYYSLSYARRTSVVMIVMQSINIAFNLTCYFVYKSQEGIICTIDYKIMVLSLLLPIALVVINGLPWRIHTTIYVRNCKRHDQVRGVK